MPTTIDAHLGTTDFESSFRGPGHSLGMITASKLLKCCRFSRALILKAQETKMTISNDT